MRWRRGHRVIVDNSVDAAALARVVAVLDAATISLQQCSGAADKLHRPICARGISEPVVLQIQQVVRRSAGRTPAATTPRSRGQNGCGTSVRRSIASGWSVGGFCGRGRPTGVGDGQAQLGYLLSGIDWRHPQETWRPTSVG